jgi:hypothetical protein
LIQTAQESGFFIGGAARSGTTLIADMLGLHTSLSAVYETDMVISFLEWIRNGQGSQLEKATKTCFGWASIQLPHLWKYETKKMVFHHGSHRILFTPNQVHQALKDFLQGLGKQNYLIKLNIFINTLFTYHSEIEKKPFWINKTPKYVVWLPELKLLFPKMKFIHCIRDGRDVACSVVKHPFGPDTHIRSVYWWKDLVSIAKEFGRQNPENYYEVKLEDLTEAPKETLSGVFNFLGVEDESKYLIDRFYSGRQGITISKGRGGLWRQELSEELKEKFWVETGELLTELGYQKN